jgi:hypothetical protein
VVSLLGASGIAGIEDTRAYANGCGIVGGTGADGDAYLISDRAELLEISDCVSPTQATYFELDANIALTSPINVIQVGSTVHSFHLDGKGYEITGLAIADTTSANIGLFDYFKGSIKNLDISGTEIATSGNAQAEVKMGTLAGSALGGEVKVENVNITLDAISAEGSGFLQLGGLFGYVSEDATPVGIEDVSIEIAGRISAESSAAKAYIGGISSTIPKGNLTNIRISADLDVADTIASEKTSVGGAIASTLTGFDKGNLVLTNFGFEGNITSNRDSVSHAGGFIGEYLKNTNNTHEVKIDKSYFRGEISDARYMGGAFGRLEDRNITTDEYISAFSILDSNFRLRVPKSDASNFRGAGLIGYINDDESPSSDSPKHTIERNFVSALFDGNNFSGSRISPAYIGESSSPLHSSALVDNYFNDDVYQNSTSSFTKVAAPSDFTGLTSANAVIQGSFSTFDFSTPVWEICAADGGPHLTTEPDRCSSTAPARVSSLKGEGGNSQVVLTWAAPRPLNSPVTDYKVEYSSDGTSWIELLDGSFTQTTSTVTDLTNGTEYFFRVSAINGQGTSAPSVIAKAIPRSKPDVITTLTATAGDGEVNLSWAAPSSNGSAIFDYFIQFSSPGTNWSVFSDGVSTNTSATVTGLTNGTEYSFRVASRNAVGFATYSDAVLSEPGIIPVTASPAPYTGPVVTSVGTEKQTGAFQTTSAATVTVYGERLSGVNKVFIENKEALLVSTSNSLFVMTLPAGLTDGVHDLVIQSSLGNLTYLDGLLISGETVEVFSYGEVSAWTSRISDSQIKVYVKFPTVGEKVRISHQVGGSGDYNTVYVKTTSSETMDGLRIVEGVGTYIVRTIDLAEINRIRVTVGDEVLVQVRYNN